MSILLLTIFLSVLLAALFVTWFIQDRADCSLRSAEQQSLLPLDKDLNEESNS